MHNRDLKTNLIGWGLCALIAAALLFVIIKDRKAENLQTQEIDEHVAQIEKTQRQRVKKRERQGDIVADLIADLDYGNYVLWGEDDWGADGDYSLSELFSEEATGRAKSLLLEQFGEDYIDGEISISSPDISDMSVVNEEMKEILVRCGVDTIAVTENFEIPAESMPANISLGVSETGEELRFAKQRDVRLGETSIAKVEGTLTQGGGEYDKDHPKLGFIRKVKGEPVQVSAGETLKIDSATDYLGSVPILFFYETEGIQNDGEKAEKFVSDLERIVNKYAGEKEAPEDEGDENGEESNENGEEGESGEKEEEIPDNRKYLVICFAEEDSALDIFLEDRFGEHYMRTNISKDRISEDNYSGLAYRMFERLDRQGCFEDLRWQISAKGEEFIDVYYSEWDEEEESDNSSEANTGENTDDSSEGNTEENSDDSSEGNTGESTADSSGGNTAEISDASLGNSSEGNTAVSPVEASE